jgi:hypothetical protein
VRAKALRRLVDANLPLLVTPDSGTRLAQQVSALEDYVFELEAVRERFLAAVILTSGEPDMSRAAAVGWLTTQLEALALITCSMQLMSTKPRSNEQANSTDRYLFSVVNANAPMSRSNCSRGSARNSAAKSLGQQGGTNHLLQTVNGFHAVTSGDDSSRWCRGVVANVGGALCHDFQSKITKPMATITNSPVYTHHSVWWSMQHWHLDSGSTSSCWRSSPVSGTASRPVSGMAALAQERPRSRPGSRTRTSDRDAPVAAPVPRESH